MKPGPNFKRGRGRGNRRPQSAATSRVSVKDGSHQEIRVRGNLQQILEKYLTLAREATSGGDRIAAENYYQHAEHYYRVLNANGGANGGHNAQNGNGPDRRSGVEGGGLNPGSDLQPAGDDPAAASGQAASVYGAAQADAETQANEQFDERQPA